MLPLSKKIFVGFITAGDGGLDYSVECCLQMISGGIDLLEIGLPFTDPVADGLTIQQSSKRALLSGATPETTLEIAKRIREKSNIPLILFSYYNPLLKRGKDFLQKAKESGFDGVLVVDYAPSIHTDISFYQTIKSCGLFSVLLISPSTSEERLKNIITHAEGFIYYACQKGTTGVKNTLPQDIDECILKIKEYTDLPVVVGFGIADKQSAKQAITHANGFVVGSAFVNLMAKKVHPSELKKLAQEIDPRSD